MSSSVHNPAGQECRAQGSRESCEVQPSREEAQTTDHSLPVSDGIIQQPSPSPETPENDSPTEATPEAMRCDKCALTFQKRHLFNKHHLKHNPPFQCTVRPCDLAFRYRKDLDRHRATRHPETVPGLVLLYCPIPGCKFSIQESPGSSRRDNLRRHFRTRHGDR